jgi:hypothetical protein
MHTGFRQNGARYIRYPVIISLIHTNASHRPLKLISPWPIDT